MVQAAEAGQPALDQAPLDRRGRKRERRKMEIIKMMALVIAERGYYDASLEEVAERLDLAKASLYYYFDSKEDLVFACLESCAVEVNARLTEIAAGAGTPTERLRRLIECQVRIVTHDNPEVARLFLHPMAWPDSFRDAVTRWRREHDEVFRGVIKDGIASGELAAADPAVSRRCLHGALGMAPEWISALEGPAYERSVRSVVDAAMKLFAVI
jgi:AcrR family transcriptional regulator